MSIEMKLEVVVVPVADVDRSKRFYANLGWRLDADLIKGPAFRIVQFTPPGSSCSIHFGIGVTNATPGSLHGTYLVVSDVNAAREVLISRGANVSEVFHRGVGEASQDGRDPEGKSYVSFATFSDPDGNSWLLQEIRQRLPGRMDTGVTTFPSAKALADALRNVAAAHGEHEKATGQRDENWPDWYAQYLVSTYSGQ